MAHTVMESGNLAWPDHSSAQDVIAFRAITPLRGRAVLPHKTRRVAWPGAIPQGDKRPESEKGLTL